MLVTILVALLFTASPFIGFYTVAKMRKRRYLSLDERLSYTTAITLLGWAVTLAVVMLAA